MLNQNTLNLLNETSVYVTSKVETLKEGKKWLMIHSAGSNQCKVNGILGRGKSKEKTKKRSAVYQLNTDLAHESGNNLVVILRDKR